MCSVLSPRFTSQINHFFSLGEEGGVGEKEGEVSYFKTIEPGSIGTHVETLGEREKVPSTITSVAKNKM